MPRYETNGLMIHLTGNARLSSDWLHLTELNEADQKASIAGFPSATFYAQANRCLSIRRFLIFDSSVVRGIPSLPAAPAGPEIRPRLSPRAASIISRS